MPTDMGTPIGLFSYILPPELIAQEPAKPRDRSRLMVLDRKTGSWQHRRFFEILDELRAGDVLVLNDSKVFRARLRGRIKQTKVELFLVRYRAVGIGEYRKELWETLMKPRRAVQVGAKILLDGLEATVLEKKDDGVVWVGLDAPLEKVLAYTDAHGEVPTPPYVKSVLSDLSKYQTVYAKEVGSVAAPTAGFHFTPDLLEKVKAKGVEIAFVTLHVGIGTFRPMKTETIEEHQMHREFVHIPSETAALVNNAKNEGRRVIAVGTTTVRTLEGVSSLKLGSLLPSCGFAGDVSIFITPGFQFRVVDALITNFHLPKSTLLVLVSAFAGRERALAAYEEAIRQKYRFYSFGDAMFIR